MKTTAVIVIALSIISVATLGGAEGIPQFKPNSAQQSVKGTTLDHEKMVEAYIPPPPIRHSWPGGYRVLIHEIINTLMDHMTGRY